MGWDTIHTPFCKGSLCECSCYMYVAFLPRRVTGVSAGVSEAVEGNQHEACVGPEPTHRGPLLEQEL